MFRADRGIEVKYSLYRKVFRSEYNLSFGSPRSDVCSFGVTKKLEIKSAMDTTRKNELINCLSLALNAGS